MNSGLTLQGLAQEVQRQKAAKEDFLANTVDLSVYTPDRREYGVGETMMDLGSHGQRPINSYAHTQLATHLSIPKTYYDRMRGDPSLTDLFDTNVNTLLRSVPRDNKGRKEQRLVRSLDGRVRAFLSDTYRPIDNSMMIAPLLTELSEYPGLQVDSSQITETRFYLKVSSPRLTAEVRVGDPVQLGVLIQNSEVGRGRWRTLPFVKRLVCVNGAIFEDFGSSRNHVGRKLVGEIEPDDILAYMSDEAMEADNKAFFLRVRDSIRAIMQSDMVLDALLDSMRFAADTRLENPEAAIKVVVQRGGLNQEEEDGILRHLIEGGDLSMWGLSNAITAAADSVHTDKREYDRSTDLQRLGAKIITLGKEEYREIVEAKPSPRARRTQDSGILSLATI